MAIYQRGGIWYIDYYAGGMRHKEAVGPKKKEAEAAIGKIKNDLREGRWFPRTVRDVSFDALLKRYEELKKDKKGYKKHVVRRIGEFFAGRIVRDINVQDVERFKAHFVALPTKAERKRGGADVNHHLNCLRAMLNLAVRLEMTEKNPAGGGNVERLPIPPGRNEYLSVDAAERLLSACHPHIRPIVLCALETGMRKSEITGLRWKEIRNGMIYLPGERTKNGRPREIPISARLSEELKKIRRQQTQGDVVTASDAVFKAHRGRPSPDGTRRLKVLTSPVKSFRNAWETAMKKAGIHPGFHFHDLRHTTASWLKMSGADDYTVMDIMGHSDFAMMKRYAHLSPQHKRTAIERLSQWAENGGPKTVPNEG